MASMLAMDQNQITVRDVRDAELRVKFAELYLAEVVREQMKAALPQEWVLTVATAQYSLDVAQDYLVKVMTLADAQRPAPVN